MDLKDKHLLVTGAAIRVGKAITDTLLLKGARVSGHHRNSPFETQHPNLFPIPGELTDPVFPEKLIHAAVQHYGKLDGIVLSASIYSTQNWEKATAKDCARFQEVHVIASLRLIQAAKPHLPKGAIVAILDTFADKALRNHLPYLISKAGLFSIVKNLAIELAPEIRVNGVSPGPVLPPKEYTEDKIARVAQVPSLKRWGTPEDVANAVCFLLENDYMTGVNLRVDGGIF